MESQGLYTTPRVAGVLLTLCLFVFVIGGLLFWARNGMAGQPAPNFAYLALERGFVMAAAVITAIGLLLFAEIVGEAHRDALLPARLAADTYAVGTVLLLLGEAGLLRSGHFPYGLIVAYVVLAFLAQAAFGIMLLHARFLSARIGWIAIAWNISWLVALAILTPGDVYFPVLYHVIPLLIGIALLRWG